MEEAGKKVLARVLEVLESVVEEATQRSPLGGIPSGELYVLVQGVFPGYTLEVHNSMVAMMLTRGAVESRQHLLVWKGLAL